MDQEEKILSTIDKSSTEQIRIRETTFKGTEYVDIRIYAKNKLGEYIPTKKGIMLNREKIQQLKNALNEAII